MTRVSELDFYGYARIKKGLLKAYGASAENTGCLRAYTGRLKKCAFILERKIKFKYKGVKHDGQTEIR